MRQLILPRRRFLVGAALLLAAAPAIVRASSLMPVKPRKEELFIADAGVPAAMWDMSDAGLLAGLCPAQRVQHRI
jgi:hypothetical protein